MAPSNEEKLEQLQRILQSRTLQGSESLKAFLRFVILKSVDNQDSQVKEYTIATEVYGRDSNYDPRTDSVVRVQAGRLRFKLHEYYTKEGKEDPVLIDLPKGHYTPAFSYLRSAEAPAVAPAVAGNNGGTPSPAESGARPRRWLSLAPFALLLLSLALGLAALSYRSEARRLSQVLAATAAEPSELQALAPLWQDFFRSPEPILLTYSNTIFQGTAETGMRLFKPKDAREQSFNSFPINQGGGGDLKDSVLTKHYTGVGEVMAVHALGNLLWQAKHPFRIKRSLLLTWDDLKAENIIVLGSPAENILIRGLPQEQDFVFKVVKGEDGKEKYGIVNLRPQEGEQRVYFATEDGPSSDQVVEDYAVVSLLKGLDAKHRLLIIAGIKTYGTQGATEYLTKPEYARELITHLNTAPAGAAPVLPPYYQALIRVKINGGVPVQASYVTHHVLK